MRTALRRASETVLSDARRSIGADEIHAWVELLTEAQAAALAPGAGPLAGVAFGVKDIIDLAGLPTRCGSELTPTTPAVRSASLVNRLLELGAVPVGKTVTTEFAYFRPGPTENPRAPGHTPGGSSSGSAAAVAAGHVPLALGSQTAGSLIRPAAYCGAAGLVLTHGAVALDGFSGLASSLDAAGLLAGTVAELVQVHAALAAPESPTPVRTALLWGGDELDAIAPAMRAAVLEAAAALRAAGVEVVPLEDDGRVAALAEDHLVVMAYEAARERADLCAVRDRLSPPLRALLETGMAVSEEAYQEAVHRAREARACFAAMLAEAVVLGPAAPGAAPSGLGATGSPIMSRPWQLLGVPQLCVPGLLDEEGLPLGVQLVGRPGGEAALLSLGCELERRLAAR